MFSKRRKKHDLALEESLGEEWSRDLESVEVPLGNKSLIYLGAAIAIAGIIMAGRIFYLNVVSGKLYAIRSEDNLGQFEKIQAPRGLIYDRDGNVLAHNEAVFTAFLDVKELLSHQDSLEATLAAVEKTLNISKTTVLDLIQQNLDEDFAAPLILKEDLNQSELVTVKGINLPAIVVESDFKRKYTAGEIFAPVVGYVGRVTADDLKNNANLTGADFIGKAGVEAFYNQTLSGTSGERVTLRNARGKILTEEKKTDPKIGAALHLTIDSGLQRYFYERLREALASLGRRVGIGLAIDPRNGEVLALVSAPSFDNNILSGPGNNEKKAAILNSEDKPLFNRVVGGFYNPGSTIKPLVGIAALSEKVINPQREIFSPGYIDIPNPYDAEKSTRYLDWRPQGHVNLASAIAQSSNVYFYLVGGGSPKRSNPLLNDESDYDIIGLGINRLHDWWAKFGLGRPTGIDLPHEAEGFLPTVSWKENKTKQPWLLGDTYNVSIGQGDLLLSPIQLLAYIGAIANGGKILEPTLNREREHPGACPETSYSASTPIISAASRSSLLGVAQATPSSSFAAFAQNSRHVATKEGFQTCSRVIADISSLKSEIKEAQKGMRLAVTSPLGTAYKLNDLAYPVAAKTGSAQVANNAQENAIFVGYAPVDRPQIAILVLIENSKEGSLNAVPVAKDVLDWYYWNRIKIGGK